VDGRAGKQGVREIGPMDVAVGRQLDGAVGAGCRAPSPFCLSSTCGARLEVLVEAVRVGDAPAVVEVGIAGGFLQLLKSRTWVVVGVWRRTTRPC
jgi:hypothetical protein